MIGHIHIPNNVTGKFIDKIFFITSNTIRKAKTNFTILLLTDVWVYSGAMLQLFGWLTGYSDDKIVLLNNLIYFLLQLPLKNSNSRFGLKFYLSDRIVLKPFFSICFFTKVFDFLSRFLCCFEKKNSLNS